MTAIRHERADAVANRARILSAARRVFAERGADAEVREISERAGVGVGTLYRHFANRADLLYALLDEALNDTLAETQRAIAIADPRTAVRALAHVMAAAHVRFGALFDMLHASRLGPPCNVDEDVPQAFAALSEAVLRLIQRGIATGSFRPDINVAVAVAMMNSCVGLFPALEDTQAPDTIADALADLWLAAFERR